MLIAAYSGMRCGEIASLKVKHIVKDPDSEVTCFDLTTAGQRKTKASYRQVPIHPRLMREVIEPLLRADPEQRLVPCNASTLSTKLNRLIDTVTEDPAVRAHSFRHGFITAMSENGTDPELRKLIVGHTSSGVHARYTHAERLAELSREIAKVRYD